jgi:drug/metabolite transporter (DMT)-like permease
MSHEQLGELAALATAVLWTLSALAWTSAGRHIGALAVAFLRLVLATVLMMLYEWLSRGKPLPLDASWQTWKMLGISGFVGFFVSDLLLFKAFLLIGPRLSLLVTSLTPPLTVLISLAMRENEHFGIRSWAGMGVTLAGVLWVVLERREGDEHPHSRQQLRRGLSLAMTATVVQSLGYVLAKEGTAQFDPAAMALIRILGAVVGYVALITVLRRWPTMVAAVRQRQAMLVLVGGAIVGPCIGVTTLMLAFKEGCHEGIVTTILATMPVMILPFSIFLHNERVGLRAVGGALLAVAGVALLMWPATPP